MIASHGANDQGLSNKFNCGTWLFHNLLEGWAAYSETHRSQSDCPRISCASFEHHGAVSNVSARSINYDFSYLSVRPFPISSQESTSKSNDLPRSLSPSDMAPVAHRIPCYAKHVYIRFKRALLQIMTSNLTWCSFRLVGSSGSNRTRETNFLG